MREIRITDEIRIDAPIDTAWLAIEDPVAHARWHPFVTEITGEHEPDQVRTCAVLVGKKPGRTRERCVEHDDHRRIIWAIEEDSSGFGRMASGWRAGFMLAPSGETTVVTAESSFRPRNLIVRAMLPMIRRKFHQTQRAILGGLKDSVESSRNGVDLSAFRS
jgi:carbon monoxide dehydrogenase subunit G